MNEILSSTGLNGLLVAQILAAAFLAILFLQSGIDKVTDWQGNLGWLTGHFAKSPLKNMVPLMLGTVTVFELAAGAASAWGVLAIILEKETAPALLGACLAATSLTMLFFGQRVAKDYAGAASLVNYFILAILAIVLFSKSF